VKFAGSLFIALLLLGPSVFAQNAVSGQNDVPMGTIKETTRVFRDKSTATMVTDPEKRTSVETIRDAAGRITSWTVYPLNDQNFAKGAIHHDAKGTVLYKEVYVFDVTGRISASKLYTGDNRPKGKRVFVYESDNKARIEDYDEYGNLLTPAAAKRKH
jgi:hypothetical protein